jgi:putative membrane protein
MLQQQFKERDTGQRAGRVSVNAMIKALNNLHQSRSTNTIFMLWVLTMVSLPILGWIMGEDYLLRGMSAGVLMQAAVVLVILNKSWGLRRSLTTFATVAFISYFAELLGSRTGFPFGKYYYTAILQPQIGGVPVLIPLAWMMMLPPAWAMAGLITKKTGRAWSFIIISALAFTAWDLFLDPQMVGWDFWRWEVPGQYYGIPLSNYLGWFLVSALLTYISNPKDLPSGPLSLVYILTWVLQTLGQGIFWSQPGPALYGFAGSGIFILFAYIRSRNEPGAD